MIIKSPYKHDHQKPLIVRRWERVAAEADGAGEATAQLVYEMLREMRMIKLILATDHRAQCACRQ